MTALLVIRSSDWFAVPSARRQSLLNCGHVKSGNGHTGIISEPHHNPGRCRIETGVIGTRHRVSTTASRNDRERFKWSRMQMLTNVSNHAWRITTNHRPRQMSFWRETPQKPTSTPDQRSWRIQRLRSVLGALGIQRFDWERRSAAPGVDSFNTSTAGGASCGLGSPPPARFNSLSTPP
jgi:hypothetical protein